MGLFGKKKKFKLKVSKRAKIGLGVGFGILAALYWYGRFGG